MRWIKKSCAYHASQGAALCELCHVYQICETIRIYAFVRRHKHKKHIYLDNTPRKVRRCGRVLFVFVSSCVCIYSYSFTCLIGVTQTHATTHKYSTCVVACVRVSCHMYVCCLTCMVARLSGEDVCCPTCMCGMVE